MFEQVVSIINFITAAFLHIWPYLLVTIPLAVAVQMSGASRHINRVFRAQPLIAILLATFVGAFSPFCSCGVVPVIAALLISGVPLAPVMSFWIASPSMDPEAFFLSVATIGWELAVWRILATLVVSLSAGYITHLVMQRGWLGEQIIRSQQGSTVQNQWALLTRRLSARLDMRRLGERLTNLLSPRRGMVEAVSCAPVALVDDWRPTVIPGTVTSGCGAACGATDETTSCAEPASFWQRLFVETRKATVLVIKFMALAFLLEALIKLYVPDAWIIGLLGRDNPYAILVAAALGVPIYTSNLAALPMVSGLLAQGMNPAAALAFLIAGPTTTLPAMAAVWGITRRRVFVLYVLFSLGGAIIAGYAYSLLAGA